MSSLPDYLPERLRQLGLREVSRILTHTNRTVMVSIGSDGTVRIHRGYAWASDRILRAVVRFLDPRVPRRLRREAQRELLAFPAEQYAPRRPAPPGPSRCGPEICDSWSGCGRRSPSSIAGISAACWASFPSGCRAGCGPGWASWQWSSGAGDPWRSRSAADTWPVTTGPRSSTPCCTRWCISGRPRAGSGWIMGRRSGGKHARSGCCLRLGARCRLFSGTGGLVRLEAAPWRSPRLGPCKSVAVTSLHPWRWSGSTAGGGNGICSNRATSTVDLAHCPIKSWRAVHGGRKLARRRCDGVVTSSPIWYHST